MNGVVFSKSPIVTSNKVEFHLAVNIEKFKFKFSKLFDMAGDTNVFTSIVNGLEVGISANQQFLNAGMWMIDSERMMVHGKYEPSKGSASFATPAGKAMLRDLDPSNPHVLALQPLLDQALRVQLLESTMDLRNNRNSVYDDSVEEKTAKNTFYNEMHKRVEQALHHAIAQYQQKLDEIDFNTNIDLDTVVTNAAVREFSEETHCQLQNGTLVAIMNAETRETLGEQYSGKFTEQNPNMLSVTLLMKDATLVASDSKDSNAAPEEAHYAIGPISKVELASHPANPKYFDVILYANDEQHKLSGRVTNVFLLDQLAQAGVPFMDSRNSQQSSPTQSTASVFSQTSPSPKSSVPEKELPAAKNMSF